MIILSCKRVFYISEHNAIKEPMKPNSEGLEMQIWNIVTDRTQRIGLKNGVSCLVIMCTPRMDRKCQKWIIFLYILLIDDSKKKKQL